MVCLVREVIEGTFSGEPEEELLNEKARHAWTEVHLEFDVPRVCTEEQCLADKSAMALLEGIEV